MKNYKRIFETEIDFYYDNLRTGYKINKQAKENLVNYTRGDYELLCKLKNYRETGLVEYVADNQFSINYDTKMIEIDE